MTAPTDSPDCCPTCGRPWPSNAFGPDGRSRAWLVRIRLYEMSKPDEAEFDSEWLGDAETGGPAPPDAPGTMRLMGLPEVAHELARMASGIHGQPCVGLGTETLMHRLKSLRPTLSRRGGNAVWRVRYQITTREDFTGYDRVQNWLARVDVQRETET